MGGAGLHGRAFIPLLSSFACAIPGIMATRVIDNKRDRLTTILVAPLMTCSARIPVYTLIISAFIPDRQVWGFIGLQGLVMFGLYAAGIVSALARVVRRQSFLLARQRHAAVHAGTAGLQAAAAAQRRDRALHPRHDVPEARRHHDLLDDGADLVPGVVPAAAGGRRRPGDRLQPRRDHRQMAGAAARRRSASTGRSTSRSFPAWRRARSRWLRSARSMRSRAARKRPSRSARRWPANGASPPRWRCWPGTSSRRSAPRRSPSSSARPEAGSWMFVTFAYMLALAYVGGVHHLPARGRARRRLITPAASRSPSPACPRPRAAPARNRCASFQRAAAVGEKPHALELARRPPGPS